MYISEFARYTAPQMDSLRNCISFLTGKAAQRVSRRARDRLAPHGVTPVQYAFLRALAEQNGQSGAELGTTLAVDSATTTGVIARLAAAGLVDRQADAGGDRRINRLVLTEAARRLLPTLDQAMDTLNAEVAAELDGHAELAWSVLQRLGGVER